jgi:hypothetical protein
MGTHGDGVPVLVHHHDGEEHAQGEEEEAVDVVLDGVADRDAKGKQKDLRRCKEQNTEDDAADGPAVVKRAEDEHELRDNVDGDTEEWP